MLFTHCPAGTNHVLTLSTEEIQILAAHLNMVPVDSVVYDFLKRVENLVDEDAIIEYEN